MSEGEGVCECIKCAVKQKVHIPRASTAREKRPSRLMSAVAPPRTRTSIEKVSDIQKYLDLIYRRENEKQEGFTLEFVSGTPEGWEYRLFNDTEEFKPPVLGSLSYEPREDEIVLFFTEGAGLSFDDHTQSIGLVDKNNEQKPTPGWKCGRIVRPPQPGRINLDDLKWEKATSDGSDDSKLFHVEEIPIVNTTLPPRTYDLPIWRLRPFSMIAELLHGVPQEEWHKNILPTAVQSTSVCLVKPCAVYGLLPGANRKNTDAKTKELQVTFRAREMWLGPEKIIEGDVVRLMPEDMVDGIDTALIVNEIHYTFENLQFADPLGKITLLGRHITRKRPASNPIPIVGKEASRGNTKPEGFPRSMRGYTWYDVDGVCNTRFGVSPNQVVGRCYEKRIMQISIWAGDLDIGKGGVSAMRKHARKHTDQAQFIWCAPRYEKGLLFHFDDRLEAGQTRQRVVIQSKSPGNGAHLNGSGQVGGQDSDSDSDDESANSESMNKMTVVSESVMEQGDDDEFMEGVLEGWEKPKSESDSDVQVIVGKPMKRARIHQ